MLRTTRSWVIRLAMGTALLAALVLGGALGARAEGFEEIPVQGASCTLLADVAVRKDCPPRRIPEREEPWLPVIQLPDPAGEPGCDQLAVVVDNIEITRCPLLGGGIAFRLDAPAALTGDHAVAVEPDYGGPSDILPFQLCFGRDEWPETITLNGPSEEEFVTAARVRAYCCATCG